MQEHREVLRFTAACALLGLAALSLPLAARAQTHYRVTGLGTLGIGSDNTAYSAAWGINNAGDVVGYSYLYDDSHTYHGDAPFVWHNGTLTQIGNFGTDSGGLEHGYAWSINDVGQVVGESTAYDSAHNQTGVFAFRYENGTMTNLGSLGTSKDGVGRSNAQAINNTGDIAGYSDAYDSAHNGLGIAGFLYHNGTFTNLGNFGTAAPGSGYTVYGNAMNDAGDIVGWARAYDSAHNEQGSVSFLYHNGTLAQIAGNFGTDSNGQGLSTARGINNLGDVVGYSDVYDNAHKRLGTLAYLYHNGTVTNLGSLGADPHTGQAISYAYSINSAGDIVGEAELSNGNFHAFLYHNGQMIDLNSLIPADSGFELAGAYGINDKGQICGITMHNGNQEAILLDPVPAEGDFNGDGHADLLWQNPTDGHTYVWLMNDLAYVGGLGTSLFAPTPDWQVVATPDLNGDGKPDFLWQNSKTGDVAYWLLDGGTVLAGNLLATGIGSDWHLVGTADLNHDGKPDLLWWNAKSATAGIWYMNGTTFTGSALLASNVTGWTLTGAMPHTTDANTSLLWRNNANGDLGYWNLDNTTVQAGGLISTGVPQDWQVAGVSDLNGDGQPDILWQNRTTGDAVVWYMKGATYLGGNAIAGTSGAKWKLIGAR